MPGNENPSAAILTNHESRVLYKVAPTPRKMTYEDIPKGTETMLAAFANDPLQAYLRDTPDKPNKDSPWKKKLGKKHVNLLLWDYVRRRVAWTINGGESIVSCVDKTRKEGPIAKLFRMMILGILMSLPKLYYTREQRKRRKEFRVKVEETEKRILGDKVAQMFHLELACTAPDSRGHGYGTILIHKVTAKADARSLETYLWSSNSANTSFYNSVGFWTVAEVAMGKDNPTWDKEPVMVALMVRKLKESVIDNEWPVDNKNYCL